MRAFRWRSMIISVTCATSFLIVLTLVALQQEFLSHLPAHAQRATHDVTKIAPHNVTLIQTVHVTPRHNNKDKNASSIFAAPVKTQLGPWKRNISDKLYSLAKEPFDVIPPTFLPGYKSPCFLFEPAVPTSLRCLPYFYLIGIQKCGTTDVWNKVTNHPMIVRTPKEQHYWARYRVLNHVPLKSYLDRQSLPMIERFEKEPGSRGQLITVDGSTSALSDNRWQNMESDPYDGPVYLAADIMREIQPDSKHIIVLRDPVTRTYSDYLFFGVQPDKYGPGLSAQSFHRYVRDDINNFENCTKSRSPRACAYRQGQHGVRTLFGYYAIYIRDWLKRFPRDQFYILRTEDWLANCTFHLKEIYKFLNLDAVSQDELMETCKGPKQFVNYQKNGYGPMLPETKVLLNTFFREKNMELSELLGDNQFTWNAE